jgi:hypothetical protein
LGLCNQSVDPHVLVFPLFPMFPLFPIVPAVPGAANVQIGLVLAGAVSFAWGCFDPGLSREHWEHREHREPVNMVSRSDSPLKHDSWTSDGLTAVSSRWLYGAGQERGAWSGNGLHVT